MALRTSFMGSGTNIRDEARRVERAQHATDAKFHRRPQRAGSSLACISLTLGMGCGQPADPSPFIPLPTRWGAGIFCWDPFARGGARSEPDWPLACPEMEQQKVPTPRGLLLSF